MRRRTVLLQLPLLVAAAQGCAIGAAEGGFDVQSIQPTEARVSRIGAFRLDGAWRVRSDDPRFGGLSALEVRDGELRAFSDDAHLVTARLVQDEVGRVSGFTDWRVERFAFDRDTDVEAVTRMPDGTLILGLERPAGLVALDPATGQRRRLAELPGLSEAPYNMGLEAVVALADGSLLAFAEGLELGDGTNRAWHVDPRGEATLLRWPVDDGFQPVDAARDAGTIYVLERSASVLSGWRSRIRTIRTEQLTWAPELVLDPLEVARIDIRPYAENYEGIAVEALGDRRWIWLISDDNFLQIQETKLLRLEVIPPAA